MLARCGYITIKLIKNYVPVLSDMKTVQLNAVQEGPEKEKTAAIRSQTCPMNLMPRLLIRLPLTRWRLDRRLMKNNPDPVHDIDEGGEIEEAKCEADPPCSPEENPIEDTKLESEEIPKVIYKIV